MPLVRTDRPFCFPVFLYWCCAFRVFFYNVVVDGQPQHCGPVFCHPEFTDDLATMPSTDPRWQFEAWRREFYVVGTLLPPPWSRPDRG